MLKIFKYYQVLNMRREFWGLEKFYCMSGGNIYEVHIMNGKLEWNNNGNFELCHLSPMWLLGKYTIERPEEEIGVTLEEIFFNPEFLSASEFRRVGSLVRYRLNRGVLEYYSTKFEVWSPRTIDKGVDNLIFTLNEDA